MKRTIRQTLLPLLMMAAVTVNGFAQQDPLYKDASQSVEKRVEDLLGRMTLAEKIAQMRHIHSYSIVENGQLNTSKLEQLLEGKSMGFVEGITWKGKDCLRLMNEIQQYLREHTRLGIPAFTVTESLHGSVHDGSTIFPQAIALGSTFNPSLAYEMTSAISEELRAQGITQSLTPVIDVCRDLRWGRVEECFGEDPFLISRMGVAQVKGYLNHRISPMIKHFGAHGTPQGGLNLASVACGQRELLSVYLQPFETVVKEAQPWAVMSSYDSWNNEPNSSSHYLLTELLRHQWGFKGYVYSDWGSIGMLDYFHHTAHNSADAALQALTAGLDAEASDNCYEELQQLVENGWLDTHYIDQAVRRILTAKFSMGLFDYELPQEKDYERNVHTADHIALARQIAEESIVLVQNNDHILPLSVGQLTSIAVIGPNADQVQFGDYTWSRDNKDGVTLLSALKQQIGDRVTLRYAKGCDLVTDNREGFAEAVAAARLSDVSIVVVGSASASLARDYSNATCGEGFDLSDLTLTGVQEDLIKEIHATGKPIVVVLLAGKPFAMPWVKEHIPGIIVQWYPGEQGGNALADVLLGAVNPSGKLNYSFPQSTGHLPCFYNYLPSDKGFYHSPGDVNKPGRDYVFSSPAPLWAFGHGLSYTEFEYMSAHTDRTEYTPQDTIAVTVTLRNTGQRDGQEVVQVYVRDRVSSVATPIHELKGFQKLLLRKGATEQAVIRIPVAELALYNQEMQRVVEDGDFELQIGRASDDIRIRKVVHVTGGQPERIPPTREDRKNGRAAASVHTTDIRLTVKGVVRDVQAGALQGITVSAGSQQIQTNEQGMYQLQALSSDTLTVAGVGYKTERIPIDGRQVINVRLLTTY